MIARLLGTSENEAKGSLIARIRTHPYRSLVFLLCVINISLAIVSFGLFISAAVQKLFFAADFTSFYTGYYLVRIGQGANLYDAALQSQYQQQFMQGMTFKGGVLLFPNPPFVAVLFAPLSFAPINTAFYIWSFIQLALLAWFLISINRLFSHWSKIERVVMMLTLLAFWPLVNTFLLGQFSLILLVAATQFYITLRDRKQARAGLWLFGLAIKPQLLLLPGMMTLNRRYLRIALVSAITGCIVLALSVLVIGIKPWIGYLDTVKSLGSYFGEYGVNPNSEYTLRGILSNLLGNSAGNITNIISSTILLIGMVLTWLLWKQDIRPDSPRFSLSFSVTIFLSIFLSLHLNPHDSLLLILPLALFYDYLRSRNRPTKAFVLLLLISPMIFLFSAFNPFALFGFLRPPVIVILILLVWMMVYLVKEFRSTAQNEEPLIQIS